MIQVQGLTRRYGDTVAVSGLSFSVKEGEIVGFSRPKRRRKNHNYEYDHRVACARQPELQCSAALTSTRMPIRRAR